MNHSRQIKAQTHRVSFITSGVVRVQIDKFGLFRDSALNRYGFITHPSGAVNVACEARSDANVAQSEILRVEVREAGRDIRICDLRAGREVLRQVGFDFTEPYASVRFGAAEDEDWIGFGDQTRERLFHRGHEADLWVRNVSSYIPVAFFMSTRGVGVLVNTTHHVVFDMCRREPGHFSWRDARGVVDYYVMAGRDFREVLDRYTALTGRPNLPPLWAFGLWYICRTHANDYEVVNDALSFRREGVPCDVIGLEPGWMEKSYDLTTDKKWHPERFPIPDYWRNMPHHFFDVLKRMGFRLELWLCNEYDLSHEVERRARRHQPAEPQLPSSVFSRAGEEDVHFNAPRFADQITKKGEAWFEHLKKFVDMGADFFKQDGAFQVCDHPDRVWGNGMLDAEMHNLYPLLYSRQMYEGFAEYAKRRPVVFTPCGWTGFHAWCGTWTGDTGGRLDTLGGMLNTAAVGHAWITNDMETAEKEGIHFGYLQPWSQINSWNYFRAPWLQGAGLAAMHRFYAELRSRLVPYLYTWARAATETGWPLMVPLPLEFPSDTACRAALHQYLLGRDLMVTIYKRQAYFPDGRWKDFWTGETVAGPGTRAIAWPEDRGGGLYLRAGAIVPLGPVMQYRNEKPLDEVELLLLPNHEESTLDFYEDDGVSFAFQSGEFALTRIALAQDEVQTRVSVGPTHGRYAGRPAGRTWSFAVALDRAPSAVEANGRRLPQEAWTFDAVRKVIRVKAHPGPVEVRLQR